MTRKLLNELPTAQRLTAARALACRRMPYFENGILSLIPVEFPGQVSMAVTDDSKLLVNYEQLGRWTAEEGATAVLHEYLHVFFRHAERAKALRELGCLRTKQDLKEWGIAVDCEINDGLEEAGLTLPDVYDENLKSIVKPVHPRNYDLPLHCSAEHYFHTLVSRRPEPEQKPEGADQGQGQGDQDQDQGDQDQDQDQGSSPGSTGADDDMNGENPGGWGRCGSGAGNPVPNEPSRENSELESGRSPAEQEAQRKADAIAIQQYSGRVPTSLRVFAGDIDRPKKQPWTKLLLASARAACSFVEGRGTDTFGRRNRYQSGMDMFGTRKAVLPGVHKPMAKVALVIDTSGSMNGAYGKILGQAEEILRTLKGGKLQILAGDTDVKATGVVRSATSVSELLIGGGGTDFRPLFEHIKSMSTKDRPSVIVFATDGYGDYPEAPVDYARVVWLVTPGGRIEVPWGDRVEIDETDEGS
jgi:predicted metal-dependent peptidase